MNDQLKGGLQAVVASSIDIITSEILGKAQFYIQTLSAIVNLIHFHFLHMHH